MAHMNMFQDMGIAKCNSGFAGFEIGTGSEGSAESCCMTSRHQRLAMGTSAQRKLSADRNDT